MNVTLEISRGLAALWVFMFHIKSVIFKVSPLVGKFAKSGYLGVPLFFVISGYCLYASASSTMVKGHSSASFIKRRLLRIYPPFWASIIVVIIFPFIIQLISSLKSGIYVAPSLSYVNYSLRDWLELISLTKIFSNTNGDFIGAFSQVNGVYWSLAIEVQFYVIIYVSMFFETKWTKVLSLVLVLSLLSLSSEAIRNSGLFMVYWPAFSCGLILRALHEKGITPEKYLGHKAILVSCSVSAVMILALYFSLVTYGIDVVLAYFKPIHSELIIFALFITVLFWFLGHIETHIAENKLFENRHVLKLAMKPFVMMGAASYSIYLLHAITYEVPAMVSRQIFSQSSPLYILGIIIPTICFCYCFHQLAEKPFMSQGYKKRIKTTFSE